MVLLFAALIVPRLIDWNQYRDAFQHEAERLLGQPVLVAGEVDATLLPTPTLVFSDVKVGADPDAPMMTVARFSVRLDMAPLLSGEFRIIDMVLEQPHMRVAVDANGLVDWFDRSEVSRTLSPERIGIESVVITDGQIDVTDAGSGWSLSISDIATTLVEARSLYGPWRIDGAATVAGVPATFSVSTGRFSEERQLGVTADVTLTDPAVAGRLTTNGTVAVKDDDLIYGGTFTFARREIVAAAPDAGAAAPASAPLFTVAGEFALDHARLDLPRLAFTHTADGPDRSFSIEGAGGLDLGRAPRFDAAITSRQIDLDRLIGGGPTRPTTVADAVERVLDGLEGIRALQVPGTLSIDVPGIVVGGGIVQNFKLKALADTDRWLIDQIDVRLPGRTDVHAEGTLVTGEPYGFSGRLQVGSDQPATFATWWRGAAGQPGVTLQPFRFAADLSIATTSIDIDQIEATFGDATITGWFGLRPTPTGGRDLRLELDADRFDFDQLDALARVVLGPQNLASNRLAETFSIKLAADQLVAGQVSMADVAIDARLTREALTVTRFRVGDLAGARLEVTEGNIKDLDGVPTGSLLATLDAETLDGVAQLLSGLLPDLPASRWLTMAAPHLTPASLEARITASAEGSGPRYAFTLAGEAGGTRVDASASVTGNLSEWRTAPTEIDIALASPSAPVLGSQAGLALLPIEAGGPADIRATGRGVAATGLTATLGGTVAGAAFRTAGTLTLPADSPPTYAGGFEVTAADIEPLLLLAGLGPAATGLGTAVSLAGDLSAVGSDIGVVLESGDIAGTSAKGDLRLAGEGEARVLGGTLSLSEIDLAWLGRAGLGGNPLPTGAASAIWSREPFAPADFGGFRADINIAAESLVIADDLAIADAGLRLGVKPGSASVDISSGSLAGGRVNGLFSVTHSGGQASLTGRWVMEDVVLADVVWRRDGDPVASGRFNFQAQFAGSGRSPAGLVAMLNGNGTAQIADGALAFFSPDAFGAVIAASDGGQDLSEERLRRLTVEQLDRGGLAFDAADVTFEVVGGVIEPQTVFIAAGAAEASVRGRVDLTDLTLASTWQLRLVPGPLTVDGVNPEVTIGLAGPIVGPSRQINVAPLIGYLALRDLQRADRLDAEILERERLNRLLDRLDHDREMRDREAAATQRSGEAQRQRDADDARRRAAAAEAARVSPASPAATPGALTPIPLVPVPGGG